MTNPEQFPEPPQVDPNLSQPYPPASPQVSPTISQPYQPYPSAPPQIDPMGTYVYPNPISSAEFAYPVTDASISPVKPPRSIKAIVALILSIIGTPAYPLVFIAIILAVFARRDIARGKTRGKIIANIALIWGIIFSVILFLNALIVMSGYNS